MEDNKKDIHYIVFEGIQARNERLVHRLIRVIVLLIMMLMLTNGAWLYYLLQYDYAGETTTTTEYSQDGTGNNIIGNDNEVNTDESEVDSDTNSYTPEKENKRN